MMDEMQQTQAAYTQIAASYAAATQDRQAVAAHLEMFLRLVPLGSRVLDLGCGPGFDTAVLRQQQRWAIGLDLSWPMMQAGRRHGLAAPCVQGDMCALPLADTAVDGVWACASLLHLPRSLLPTALAELARTLRPRGVLYLSVKTGSGEGWAKRAYEHDAARFFVYWQPETLDPLLTQAGFVSLTDGQDVATAGSWLARFAYKETR